MKIEDFTNGLQNYFSPDIQWPSCIYEYRNMSFGIIYVYKLKNKPAICKKDYDNQEKNIL